MASGLGTTNATHLNIQWVLVKFTRDKTLMSPYRNPFSRVANPLLKLTLVQKAVDMEQYPICVQKNKTKVKTRLADQNRQTYPKKGQEEGQKSGRGSCRQGQTGRTNKRLES